VADDIERLERHGMSLFSRSPIGLGAALAKVFLRSRVATIDLRLNPSVHVRLSVSEEK
jgi:hypothetical protein